MLGVPQGKSGVSKDIFTCGTVAALLGGAARATIWGGVCAPAPPEVGNLRHESLSCRRHVVAMSLYSGFGAWSGYRGSGRRQGRWRRGSCRSKRSELWCGPRSVVADVGEEADVGGAESGPPGRDGTLKIGLVNIGAKSVQLRAPGANVSRKSRATAIDSKNGFLKGVTHEELARIVREPAREVNFESKPDAVAVFRQLRPRV